MLGTLLTWPGCIISGVLDRMQELEDTSQKLHEFDDVLQDLDSQVKKCEDKLATHKDLGSTAKDSKHLDKVKVRGTSSRERTPRNLSIELTT